MTLALCPKGGTQKKKEEKYACKRLFFAANPPWVVPPIALTAHHSPFTLSSLTGVHHPPHTFPCVRRIGGKVTLGGLKRWFSPRGQDLAFLMSCIGLAGPSSSVDLKQNKTNHPPH
jgi:hypothetical protein